MFNEPVLKMKATAKDVEIINKKESVFVSLDEGVTKIRLMSDVHVLMEHYGKIGDKWSSTVCATEQEKLARKIGASQATDELPPCSVCEKGWGFGGDAKVGPYLRSARYVALVFMWTKDKDGKEVQQLGVLKTGATVLGKVLKLEANEDWGDYKQYDISIDAVGKGMSREYTVDPTPKDKSRIIDDKMQEQFINFNSDVNLDKMSTPLPYDEVVKKLEGLTDAPEASDDDQAF